MIARANTTKPIIALDPGVRTFLTGYDQNEGFKFGEDYYKVLAEKLHRIERIKSGSIGLDLALGGGYPKGRVIEIYGPESSGKTTLTIHAMIEAQRQGGAVGFVDAERDSPKNNNKPV